MIIEFLTSGLLGFWLKSAGITEPQPQPASPVFPTTFLKVPDAERDRRIDAYLDSLAQSGFTAQQQGLWLQTDQELLADHQGDQLQTPASLTKVATTLAAIKTWGLGHRFTTELWAIGTVVNGVLEGDLWVQGDGDPLLATPEAIAMAQQLNALGIRRVTGNLIVAGAFSVNFATDLQTAGETLKTLWNGAPHSVAIAGTVAVVGIESTPQGTLLGRHQSLPLADLLRFMNVYSNNPMAEWLAEQVGGPEAMQAIALQTGRVVPAEIQLKNGSGLEQENKLSPRAVVGLLQAIQTELDAQHLTLAELFPTLAKDKGTVEKRHFPKATVVKTGTLWNTSGLAGMLPTRRYGPVWFAIMNRGDDFTDGFRKAQDQLLQSLVLLWGKADAATVATASVDLETVQRRKALDAFLEADFWSH